MAVLLTVFLPVLTTPYAHHDQYRYFAESRGDIGFKDNCGNDSQYRMLYLLGRPLAAECECLVFKHSQRLTDLARLRFGVISVLAMAATCFAGILRRYSVGLSASIAMSIAAFVLPGAQNAVFMTNFPNVLAPLGGLVSYWWLEASETALRSGRRSKAVGSAVASLAVLLSAFFAYPFLALVFLCASLAHLLFEESDDWRSKAMVFVRDSAFFGAAAVLYWSAAKTFLVPSDPVAAHIPSPYHFALTLGKLGPKLSVLFQDLTPRMLTFWMAEFSWLVAGATSLVIVTGLVLYLVRGRAGDRCWPLRVRLLNIAGVVGLLFVVNLPFLLSDAFFLFRVFFAYECMWLLILFWSLDQLWRRSNWRVFHGKGGPLVACALCAVGCLEASVNTSENVLNSYMELAFVKMRIASAGPRRIDRIHVVESEVKEEGFNGHLTMADEFNAPTTNYSVDIANFVRVALMQIGRNGRYVVDGDGLLGSAGVPPCCKIEEGRNDRFYFTDERGGKAEGSLEGDRLQVVAWPISGTVDRNRTMIQWSDGTAWVRDDLASRLIGPWSIAGADPSAECGKGACPGTAHIQRVEWNRFRLTNGKGESTEARLDGFDLRAVGWPASGTVAPDLSSILWSDGLKWSRLPNPNADIEGAWARLDRNAASAILVTSSARGQVVRYSPNMLIVDMDVLRDCTSLRPPPRCVVAPLSLE